MRVAAAVVTTLSCLAACAPFSEFQSARTLGPGRVELTPSMSAVGSSGGLFQNHLGVQGGVGLVERVDLRARYEHVWGRDGSEIPFDVVGFGPKIALEPNRTALYVPFGFGISEDFESRKTWEMHPTLIGTHVVNDFVEVNTAFKVMLPLTSDDPDVRFAVDLGCGVGPEELSFMLRPEAGVMFGTNGGSPVFHFGFGVSWSTTSAKRTDEQAPRGKVHDPWGSWEEPDLEAAERREMAAESP